MAKTKQTDVLARLADAGEEVLSRLASSAGMDRVTGAVTNLKDQVDALASKVRGMEKLEKRVEDLERKVEQRTEELAQSVGELRALGEVSQAVNSTLDLETVLNTIVSKAVQLSGTEAGAIYVHDEVKSEFELRSTYGMSEELIAAIREHHVRVGVGAEARHLFLEFFQQPAVVPARAIERFAGTRVAAAGSGAATGFDRDAIADHRTRIVFGAATRVIDRAIQVHGGAGVTDVTPLAAGACVASPANRAR